MGAVASSSRALPFVLLSFTACSTAALPVSQFDDEDVDEAPTPQDAGRPLDAALLPPVRDAALPPSRDSSVIFPPTPDAGPIRVPDAGPPRPLDAAVFVPPDMNVMRVPDAGTSSCVIHNPAGCPATASACNPGTPEQCAYPNPMQPGALILRTCAKSAAVTAPILTSVQCQRSCFDEIPRSFEELQHDDCQRRPLFDCATAPTDQLAVDGALKIAAQGCGLSEYHLGLIFTANGCARALFSLEVKDPALRCIAKQLASVRFTCSPLCAIANSDEKR
jgi:hypothetical protein